MKTLSLRLPERLYAKLSALARKRNTTKAAVARDALTAIIELDESENGSPGSAFDQAGDLIGSIEGRRDLSSNPRNMRGYGK